MAADSAPLEGSNHRKVMLRRDPVPSETRSDEEDVSEEFVSGTVADKDTV
jgi:hypothetical protein